MLAAERPILAAVDDVQRLDPASARLLAFAAPPSGAVRAALDAAWLRRRVAARFVARVARGLVRRLVPKPLSLASLQQIFSSQLGMSFPRPLLARIADASGGNPFFALEIAQATARRKHELSLDEPLAVPRRLEDLIAERVHTLSDPARRAVEGRPSVVLDAHSLYVETIAEIGPVGLALLTVTWPFRSSPRCEVGTIRLQQ